MDESNSNGANPPATSEGGTERAIRYAVYLTGGLVMLALGVSELASALGTVLSCVAQTVFCPGGGFSSQFYYETLPVLGGGAFLIVVATVLFIMARRTR
ncbi:MAG: hypothetical protein ACLQAS_08725 [Thermoplasmata archaeon]